MFNHIHKLDVCLNLLKNLEEEVIYLDKINEEIEKNLILDLLNLTKISLSLSSFYLLGYIRSKSLEYKFLLHAPRYKIVADNITTLKILDTHLNSINLKRPEEVFFSEEYKDYSKEDVARIAYICGQLSIKKIYLETEKIK